jgi:hypothetical protein
MSKTAEVYDTACLVFILLVILFGVLRFLRNKQRFVRGGHEQAAPPKKHHFFKKVFKTGLMLAPFALLAL